MSDKNHWENIYQTKALNTVSWYQEKPSTSLAFFEEFKVAKNAKIIDIGGGDSFLADHLLALGYQDITVLDISESALERAKKRLGKNASAIKWIVADIATFNPSESYDFWHDRAAFHFLNQEKDIQNYIQIAAKSIRNSGIMIVGTFSETGPTKCSGIEIKQYSQQSLAEKFQEFFEKIRCFTTDHTTPSGSIQNFTFCSFRKK